MPYFCTAMRSGARVASARSSEARRFRAPLAVASLELSGRASNTPRPTISSRRVEVAAR
jgi:hypothetical protein